MSPSPAPEAHEAALAELLGQHRPKVFPDGTGADCSCGADFAPDDCTVKAFREAHDAHVASVLLAAGWLPPETVTEARARGDVFTEWSLSVPALGDSPGADVYLSEQEARDAVESASKKWSHGNEVVVHCRTVTPWARADSLAPEAPSEEQR